MAIGSSIAKYSVAQRERALQVIDECQGELTAASKRLGISIATLCRWRKALLIEGNASVAGACATDRPSRNIS